MRTLLSPYIRAFILTVVVLIPTRPAAAQPAPSSPRLAFLPNAAQALMIGGSGWRPNAVVVFTVRVGTQIAGEELRASSSGDFAVRVRAVSLCDRPTFLAADFHQGTAHLQGPALGCPQRIPGPKPILTVIEGKKVHLRVDHLALRKASTSLRQGDVLSIGAIGPPGTLQTDPRYLLPFSQSPSPVVASACGPSTCVSNGAITLVALHTGRTIIVVAPLCRQSMPPCMVAERSIKVRITR